MSNVKVTAIDGKVIHQTANPEFGYMRVESNQVTFEGGFARNSKRSALITGRVEDLEAIGAFDGMSIPGKIVVTESLEPSHPKNAERELKKAGEDGPVLKSGDSPIYRSTAFTSNLEEADTLIAHTNVEEVKAYNEAQKAEKLEM